MDPKQKLVEAIADVALSAAAIRHYAKDRHWLHGATYVAIVGEAKPVLVVPDLYTRANTRLGTGRSFANYNLPCDDLGLLTDAVYCAREILSSYQIQEARISAAGDVTLIAVVVFGPDDQDYEWVSAGLEDEPITDEELEKLKREGPYAVREKFCVVPTTSQLSPFTHVIRPRQEWTSQDWADQWQADTAAR